MRETVIVDLDGTLANIDHRLHFIKCEKPDWDSFYAACMNDTSNDWCVALIQSLTIGYPRDVKIVSARSRVVEKETRSWIKDVLGENPAVELIMLRADGDYTPDDDLKMEWLKKFGKENILFVVDDRQRVVDMWRKEGLVCLQCYAWPEWKKR